MGCVSSRQDINDIHPNIFQVMNVDELGQSVSPGQLELTESEIVLYQRGKTATRWPLRCLRRYGFDAEIFSFESGRRCPTGPGIYAFRCRRAEQLFNMLQQHIQLRNLSDELVSVANELTIPAASSGPPVTNRQLTDQSYIPDSYPRPPRPSRLSRPGSVTSNGPPSPPALSPPLPDPLPSEHNNNKRTQHEYSNAQALREGETPGTQLQYVNLEPNSSPTLSSGSEYAQLNVDEENHVYMNVQPGERCERRKSSVQDALLLEDEDKHCYANLNPEEIESLTRNSLPIPTEVHTLTYIVLDLEQPKGDPGASTQAPESPKNVAKGYATIDFNKTVALSHSVNPCIDMDSEGVRKTRHNSTIGELAPVLARHSTSLSD